uniref:Uncharacterized protein n=1 Tax=Meloidogyne enterolobii TaxID=390850 RepID=A0A6V7WR73_MELEN|nr:unnamed protein product [Meloidogyne enterolobii]
MKHLKQQLFLYELEKGIQSCAILSWSAIYKEWNLLCSKQMMLLLY